MLYYPEETKQMETDSLKVVVFTCNWNAYSGLEAAGKDHEQYPETVFPVRVECLGRLHPGIILKAFEKGAAGVLMLGCPPDECNFDFGFRKAEEVYAQSRDLIRTLGFHDSQLKLDYVAAGEGKTFSEKVIGFIEGINGSQNKA